MRLSISIIFAIAFAFTLSAGEIRFDTDPLGGSALSAQRMKVIEGALDWNKKGLDLLDKNDYNGAMGCFNKAVEILPDYSDAVNNRGVVKFRRGDVSGARDIWQKLATTNPDYALASYNLALIQIGQKQYEAAIRLLERALRSEKQFIEATVRLGAVYLELGQKSKGLEYIRNGYKAAPAHPDALTYYAYALIQNADTAEAVSVLRKNSDRVEAVKLLAQIEKSRKNYAAAANYYAQAMTLGAPPNLVVDLAAAQLEEKNCSGALQTLKSYFALKVTPVADAYLTAGIAAKECGDIAASQSWFEQGCRAYPQDGVLRYNLGQVHFYQKRYDLAEKTWENLSDSLQDPSLLYLRAINAKRNNDLKTAAALIRRALELDDRAEFHDFSGVLLYREGKNREAADEFKKALAINPDLKSAQLHLALCSKNAGEIAGASTALQKKLTGCAGDSCVEFALQLSVLYYYQKLADKAAATLAAIREGDRDERVYRSLAIYYKEMQEWDKAIASLETAVKKYVSEPQTDYELAEAYLMAGYYGKSVERYKLLLNKWEGNPWRIHYQLGYAYFEQNDFDNAQKCFEKSLNSKNNVAARGLLAFILNKQGNISAARDLWKKNLTDDPSNAAMWVNMGLSYERDGKYEEAVDNYKKALDVKNNDPQIHINLGNAYTSLGQYTNALNSYKQAMGSSKKEAAEYNIFLVYSKKRDKEQAIQALRALEKDFIGSANTRRAQSEIALWEGDTAGALRLLEPLADKESGDWITLAHIYAAQNKIEKARECLAKIPDNAQFVRDRGAILVAIAFQSGNYQEVVRLLTKTPDTAFAVQYNLALARYSLNSYAEALSIAERLIRTAIGRDRADICRLAGNSSFRLKQWDKALQWYQQLSNVEARSAVVQYNLAVASYNLGKVEDSWRYYQRAREFDPGISNADIEKRYAASKKTAMPDQARTAPLDSMYNAAVGLQSAGNDSAAEKLYLRVVAKDSLYNLAWNNLGAVYGKWGEIDKAERAYQKAVEKKHDLPEAYANLVYFYLALEEFSKARRWLIKGEGHNPESDLLKDLRSKITEAEKRSGKK